MVLTLRTIDPYRRNDNGYKGNTAQRAVIISQAGRTLQDSLVRSILLQLKKVLAGLDYQYTGIAGKRQEHGFGGFGVKRTADGMIG